MAITSIQTITVPVSDQDRALAFYRDALGFEVRADNPFGSMRWLTVGPVGGETEIVLHLALPGLEAGSSGGIVLATDDIDAACAALADAGATCSSPETVL